MSEFSSEWNSVQYLAAILAVVRQLAEEQGVPSQKLLDIINEAANNP
jgi:hypothetical protein